MKNKLKKLRFEYLLMIVLAVISIGIVAIFIARSTDKEMNTIVISPEGMQSQKTTDIRILLADGSNEALIGAFVRVDDQEETFQTDSTGYVILKNITYGEHVLHIQTKDGEQYDFPFQLALDFDLENNCCILWGDRSTIKTPLQISELAIQIVLDNGSLFLSKDHMITKETGSRFLSDGTEITPDGRIYFADGSFYENGYFTFADGSGYEVGVDLIFTRSGTLVFPDGSMLSDSRAFYIVGDSVRIIGDRPADLHNGYYKDYENSIIDEDGNKILQDGTVVFSDGVIVDDDSKTMEEASQKAEEIREEMAETEIKPNKQEASEEPEPEPEEIKETKETFVPEPEQPAPAPSEPQIDPASVEEYSNQTWVQATKLHIFSDSEELSGGAFKDENGQLIIAPGSRGTYFFRIATKNQRVSFIFKLYHAGELHIPMKMQLVYPDETVSDWFSLDDAVSVQTALAFEENIVPANSYSYYAINWWWDESVDDTYDTELGVRAVQELVEYELYAVLQVTTE